MAFRDSFDKCPRCGVALEDAGAVRGCRSCGGAFVDDQVLSEMILEMLPVPPRAFGVLDLSEIQRTGTALPCPSCGSEMKTKRIHEIDLDQCPKHGVWFDPDELRVLLYKVADPSRSPPFKPWSPIEPDLAAPRPRPRPAAAPPPSNLRTVTFGILLPDGTRRDVELANPVIKVGRIATAHLRIENDPDVSRLHAVIEVEPATITIIDLGSEVGTFVNGARVTKTTLAIGDVIRVGNTQLQLVTRSP